MKHVSMRELMMIKRKVILLFSLTLILILILAGCGQSKKGAEQGKSDVAEVKIKNGLYITFDGQENTDDSALLALDVGITNRSGETLDIYSRDFTLFDADNEKVPYESSVYDDSDNFRLLESSTLPNNKTVSGYLVFRIDKTKSYELHYQPSLYDSDQKPEEIVLKVNAQKYKDRQQEITDAANAFIQNVFFGKEEPKYASLVANDAAQEQKKVKEAFKENTNIGDDISDTQLDQVYQAFQKANAESGGAELKVDSAFVDTAEVKVTPKVVNFDDMYDQVNDLQDRFVDDNRGKYPNYNSAMKAWNTYLVKHIGEVFSHTEPQVSKDSYTLKLKKEGNKWKIDSSNTSDNYDYESLVSVMNGGY
ncbi:DUF5105 domain-containing protein [Sporolactobacillus sp. THM7-7]|nr:DUF5105 domain-containing protein [Sporolactobacillus sp. THM7-7]